MVCCQFDDSSLNWPSVSTLKEMSWILANPDHFPGNFQESFQDNSRKFKNMDNICKHVEKYDFYGLKKAKIFKLAHLCSLE